jgi:hypothetical protein
MHDCLFLPRLKSFFVQMKQEEDCVTVEVCGQFPADEIEEVHAKLSKGKNTSIITVL